MGRLCRARQRVLQGRLLKCLPQADSSLRGPPARRCVSAQLQYRRDRRESVRDARRAAPRPRAAWSSSGRATCGRRLSQPRTWDDGVDGTLLCHLLFSVHDDPAEGAAMLRFRCGPVHTRWAWAVGVDRGLTSRAARHSPLAPLRSRGLRWHAWMVARRVQWSPVFSAGYRSGHGSTSEVYRRIRGTQVQNTPSTQVRATVRLCRTRPYTDRFKILH